MGLGFKAGGVGFKGKIAILPGTLYSDNLGRVDDCRGIWGDTPQYVHHSHKALSRLHDQVA